MGYFLYVVLIVLGLFAGILACIFAGYYLGRRSRSHEAEGGESFGVVGGALLGLLGLILGFSFAARESRMDARRQLIVQEANAIGTAYLRLDLLRTEDQTVLRPLFRDYADLRIKEHAARTTLKDVDELKQQATALQARIWQAIVPACEARQEPPVKGLVLPPVNEMFDISTSQAIALRTHIPVVVLLLLIVLALLSGLIVGWGMSGMKRWNRLISTVYALSIALTVYVILDLELPRLGIIRLDFVEAAMREVRAGMG